MTVVDTHCVVVEAQYRLLSFWKVLDLQIKLIFFTHTLLQLNVDYVLDKLIKLKAVKIIFVKVHPFFAVTKFKIVVTILC